MKPPRGRRGERVGAWQKLGRSQRRFAVTSPLPAALRSNFAAPGGASQQLRRSRRHLTVT
ncbi:hypothetical protein [Paenibacillus sp. FSL H8-0259]|uniref:hypothetical protein n=1 Tax=Paenibacillus sp. FSL H8-0259 TaxID=1920423 RepID=UPI0015C3BEA8|nr:hypothetical protein [Paenibacillus sp. FSL H8-0259]